MFTREFAEWCLKHGVKGKYSVVPCLAALGRIDDGLPILSRAQQENRLVALEDGRIATVRIAVRTSTPVPLADAQLPPGKPPVGDRG